MNKTILESQLDEWIAAALDGSLDPREQEEFERYLAENPTARLAYEETRNMNRLLHETLKNDRPDPGFEDRMVNRFRQRQKSRELSFWKNWVVLWQGQKTVYAGAVAALVLSFYLGGGGQSRPSASNVVLQTNGTARPETVEDFRYPESNWNEPVEGVTYDTWGNLEQREANVRGYFAADDVKSADKDPQRGDFNLNAMKVALEKPLTDEAKLQNGFGADLMLGEDKVRVGSDSTVRGVPLLGDLPIVGRAFKNPEQAAPGEAGNKSAPALNKEREATAKDRLPPVDEHKPAPKGMEERTPLQGAPDEPAVEAMQRKLIRNANIGMEVKSYATALGDLTRLAQEEKGFVATQNDRTQANGHTAGQLVIKLPPGQLEEFVLRLREVGKVQRQVLKMDDVTKAYFDTEARLRNAKKTEERLLELMAKKTDKVADLLQVEQEIGRVRESIEQMQGELKLWDALASLATVTLDLVEEDMDQAAAYLLKETAHLSLYSADVEKSYQSARAAAEKAEAQIVTAQINRSNEGQMNATLSLLAAPEKAFALIEQLKSLGRVQSFEQDTQRVAQDGRAGMAGSTRRDKVEIQISIVHDDASRKTVTLQVITSEVERALDQCKKAALAASGEILASNLQRGSGGHSQAVLTVRLPSRRLEEIRAVFSGQGRVVQLTVQRNDEAGTHAESEDDSPVILALTLSDEEAPVQITKLGVEGENVAAKVDNLKNRARGLGAEIRASSFSRSPEGVEQANLVFRMMQKDYPTLLEALQETGRTLKLTLERRDRVDSSSADAGSEPVEVIFFLKSPPPIVGSENGLVAAVRQTLGKSFAVLFQGVERIVTGLAYLLPWLAVGGLGWWGWRRWRGKQ